MGRGGSVILTHSVSSDSWIHLFPPVLLWLLSLQSFYPEALAEQRIRGWVVGGVTRWSVCSGGGGPKAVHDLFYPQSCLK